MVVGSEEGEAANPGENLVNGSLAGAVRSSIPDGDLRAACEAREPSQLAVGVECAIEVARVEKNSIDDVDIKILIASQLNDTRIVGLAVNNDVE